MNPPRLGELGLGIGRSGDSHKDLYWRRLAAEYRKEAPLRQRGSEAALRVDLAVRHAPDDHTPFSRVDWGDPMDVRGATALARKLVEDGGAAHAVVEARASRPSQGRHRLVLYDLAKFERA